MTDYKVYRASSSGNLQYIGEVSNVDDKMTAVHTIIEQIDAIKNGDASRQGWGNVTFSTDFDPEDLSYAPDEDFVVVPKTHHHYVSGEDIIDSYV